MDLDLQVRDDPHKERTIPSRPLEHSHLVRPVRFRGIYGKPTAPVSHPRDLRRLVIDLEVPLQAAMTAVDDVATDQDQQRCLQ